jgi:glycosyltransferase involved in cell wall biosynthesis
MNEAAPTRMGAQVHETKPDGKKSKLAVVVVTSFPRDPDNPCGGVESVSVNLVRALSRLDDLDVHAITTDPACPAVQTGTWRNVRLHRLPQRGKNILSDATGPGRRQMKRYLARLAPDVVHAHDVYGLMVKGLAVPRVFTVHGFIHKDTAVSGTRFARLRAILWRQIETAGWADQPNIISINPYVHEYVKNFTQATIFDIDNPLGEAFFDIPRREIPGRIFCAAGGINPRKNVLGLVRAFARLVDQGVPAELRISGGAGDKSYYRQVLDFIHDHQLENRITLLGRIDFRQICEELATAAVFTLVSLEENSPMSIEEAMAAGLPVVTSNCCGMPYMVRDGESGYLVHPNQPEEVAGCFRTLLEDPDLRHAMGEKSRQIALDRFHPDRVAQRTRHVYRRAVEDHKLPVR